MGQLHTSKLFVTPLLLALVLVSTGCATIFHNQRVNQPSEERGKVDWLMVALDVILTGCIGLVVDLATGALWIPKEAPAEAPAAAPAS